MAWLEISDANRISAQESIRTNPDLLAKLDLTPAFQISGTQPGKSDVSIGEFLTSYFDPRRSHEPAKELAQELDLTSTRIKEAADFYLGWLRGDPRIDQKRARSITTRVETFSQLKNILNNPTAKQTEFLEQFLPLPFFNPKNAPASVTAAAQKLIGQENFDPATLPTIGDFFQNYLGLGRQRQLTETIRQTLGYDQPSMDIYRYIIFALINRNCGTNIPIESEKVAHENLGLRLEARYLQSLRARELDLWHLPVRNDSIVSDCIIQFLTWGLQTQQITTLLNQQLQSINQFGAKSISVSDVERVNATLSGTQSHGLVRGRNFDQAEQAARFSGPSRRAQLILKVLDLVSEGYSQAEILYALEFKDSQYTGALQHQALLELKTDATARRQLQTTYLEVTGSYNLDVRLNPGQARQVYHQLYEIYLGFRQRLGDNLSDYEKTLLAQVAGGKDEQDIAREMNTPGRYVNIEIRSLLETDFGNVRSLDKQQQELENLYRIFSNIGHQWSGYYRTESLFKDDRSLLYDRLQLKPEQFIQRYGPDKLGPAMRRIRAVAMSIRGNKITVWKTK